VDLWAMIELAPPIWDTSLVNVQNTWDIETPTLLPLLGLTTLPLTHMMGVVEHSTQWCIVHVKPPHSPWPLTQNVPAMEGTSHAALCGSSLYCGSDSMRGFTRPDQMCCHSLCSARVAGQL